MLASYLQDWSSPEYGSLHPAGIAFLAECSQTVNQEISTLSLSWATFSRNDDALVDPFPEHGVVGHICNSKNMRLQFSQLVLLVHLDVLGIVDGQELKGVDGDEDAACIGVYLILVKACAQVV